MRSHNVNYVAGRLGVTWLHSPYLTPPLLVLCYSQGENRLANAIGTLRGLKVLDLSIIVAGGTASSLMADFGAEVVKAERPGSDGQIDAVARRGII